MQIYYGIMEYFGTGAGVTVIYFVGRAKTKESFREEMIKECEISAYYHVGIDIFDEITENTPPVVLEFYRQLKDGVGFMKFYSHVNYS